MEREFRILGTLVVLWDTIYLVWLAFHVTPLGILLLIGEFLIASLTYLLIVNHWSQEHTFTHHNDPKGSVDVFIPTVDEPLPMLDNTIRAATNIAYANKKVFVLDDGPREEVRAIATKYGATYVSRDQHARKNGKAGNLNHGMKHGNGDYILVIDADHVVQPAIIEDLLGHFDDDAKVAIVATRQAYLVPEGDFNHDVLFYQHMQAGRNSDNAAISCGNGVFYRRTALNKIGGFQEWNLVEDLYTSYVLHLNGFRTVYVNQPYTFGTAPMDLSDIYKQRGTWALDTLRMAIWHSPLFARGLSWRQRLHYVEIAYAYIVSAIAMPILFTLPAIALLADDQIVTDPLTYLLLRIPSLLLIIYFYYRLSGNMFSQMQLWASLWPVYFKAFMLALSGIKTKYRVTNKLAGQGKREIFLVIPHILLVLFSAGVVIWRIFWKDDMLTSFTGINLMWMTLMTFWFAPIIQKGFQRAYGRIEQSAIIQRAIESVSMGLLAILIAFGFQQAFATAPASNFNEALVGPNAAIASTGDIESEAAEPSVVTTIATTVTRFINLDLGPGNGRMMYLDPSDATGTNLKNVADVKALLDNRAVGITNVDLEKIPVGFDARALEDTDIDGIPDEMELAIGTNPSTKDTDGDGFEDKTEIANGYSATSIDKVRRTPDSEFAKAQLGKIFIQVEAHGEAWYVNPVDAKRYYLGRPEDAFAVLQVLQRKVVGVVNVSE